MISIVVPAHNEEAVIERCLRSLTEGADAGEIEVVVACNGCTDRTAELARGFGEPVRVVETSTASKTAGLNLGDEAATSFPRCYIDADVQVDLDTVRKVAAVLDAGEALAAAPRMKVDLSGASWPARAFYAIWLRQPYHGPGMIGGGFYALSEAGRARFARFPSIIADDEFVRSHFTQEERATPVGCEFTITAPRTLGDVIRVKTRSRLGTYQLRRTIPERAAGSRAKGRGAGWFSSPVLWPSAAMYLFINVVTRLRARRQLRTIDTYEWERDESSRLGRPAAAGSSAGQST